MYDKNSTQRVRSSGGICSSWLTTASSVLRNAAGSALRSRISPAFAPRRLQAIHEGRVRATGQSLLDHLDQPCRIEGPQGGGSDPQTREDPGTHDSLPVG